MAECGGGNDRSEVVGTVDPKSVYPELIDLPPFAAGPIPLRVREAEIPIVSDAECIRKINAVTEKIFILPASSFCAGGEAGNDACQVTVKQSLDLSLMCCQVR